MLTLSTSPALLSVPVVTSPSPPLTAAVDRRRDGDRSASAYPPTVPRPRRLACGLHRSRGPTHSREPAAGSPPRPRGPVGSRPDLRRHRRIEPHVEPYRIARFTPLAHSTTLLSHAIDPITQSGGVGTKRRLSKIFVVLSKTSRIRDKCHITDCYSTKKRDFSLRVSCPRSQRIAGPAKARRMEAVAGRMGAEWWSGRCRDCADAPARYDPWTDAWPVAGRRCGASEQPSADCSRSAAGRRG